MKYNGIIENKLRIIEEKEDSIKNWKIDSFRDLQENSMLHLAVERALQIAIEAMIDVAERILALKKIPPQNSSALSLKKLQELNILENEKDIQQSLNSYDPASSRDVEVNFSKGIDLLICCNPYL